MISMRRAISRDGVMRLPLNETMPVEDPPRASLNSTMSGAERLSPPAPS
jgi:hypothetical protein